MEPVMISTVFTGKLPPTNLHTNKNVFVLEGCTRRYNQHTSNWAQGEKKYIQRQKVQSTEEDFV